MFIYWIETVIVTFVGLKSTCEGGPEKSMVYSTVEALHGPLLS